MTVWLQPSDSTHDDGPAWALIESLTYTRWDSPKAESFEYRPIFCSPCTMAQFCLLGGYLPPESVDAAVSV
eukprot:jgi/Botrbrau1/18543/Bobra.0824s0001.1